jgi:hypothetical protein
MPEKNGNPTGLNSGENNGVEKGNLEKRCRKPLLDKGLERYWNTRKRLDLYCIQPDFLLILHLNKRLINGSIHSYCRCLFRLIPYRSGTDFVAGKPTIKQGDISGEFRLLFIKEA